MLCQIKKKFCFNSCTISKQIVFFDAVSFRKILNKIPFDDSVLHKKYTSWLLNIILINTSPQNLNYPNKFLKLSIPKGSQNSEKNENNFRDPQYQKSFIMLRYQVQFF